MLRYVAIIKIAQHPKHPAGGYRRRLVSCRKDAPLSAKEWKQLSSQWREELNRRIHTLVALRDMKLWTVVSAAAVYRVATVHCEIGGDGSAGEDTGRAPGCLKMIGTCTRPSGWDSPKTKETPLKGALVCSSLCLSLYPADYGGFPRRQHPSSYRHVVEGSGLC